MAAVVLLDFGEGSDDQKALDGINHLLRLIASGARPMTIDSMFRMVLSETSTFLAWEDGMIVGMASITVSHLPSGVICRIHDMIVDYPYRNQGIGSQLMDALLTRLPENWHLVDVYVDTPNSNIERICLKTGFRMLCEGRYTLSPY